VDETRMVRLVLAAGALNCFELVPARELKLWRGMPAN
jgi:hypothetical protein